MLCSVVQSPANIALVPASLTTRNTRLPAGISRHNNRREQTDREGGATLQVFDPHHHCEYMVLSALQSSNVYRIRQIFILFGYKYMFVFIIKSNTKIL